MKPLAKKGLIVLAGLYLITVAVMVANFKAEQKPRHPEQVTQNILKALDQVRQQAYAADPDHIRSTPLRQADAARVFESVLRKKGTIINVNYTLIIQCLNFAVLLLLLYGLVWDPMLRLLDRRRALIKQRLDESVKNREQAAQLARQRQEELNALREQRSEILQKARELGEQERRQIVQRARLEAERMLQEGRDRIAEELRQARTALRAEVADIAIAIAAQVLRREISRQEHEALINEVMDQMAAEQAPSAGATGGTR